MTGGTATAPAPATRRSLRWLPYLMLVAVAVVALAIGIQRHSGPATIEQRTMSIAGKVRCPVCEGETAAESQTVASIGIRAEIRKDLVAGVKTPAILAAIEAEYPDTLETPRTQGVDLLLWVLPVVAFVVAAGGLVGLFVYWRPRRTGAVGASDADRSLVAEALGQDGVP